MEAAGRRLCANTTKTRVTKLLCVHYPGSHTAVLLLTGASATGDGVSVSNETQIRLRPRGFVAVATTDVLHCVAVLLGGFF